MNTKLIIKTYNEDLTFFYLFKRAKFKRENSFTYKGFVYSVEVIQCITDNQTFN